MALRYQLTDNYVGQALIDGFNFVTSDPTHGFISYQDKTAALGKGLASVRDSSSGKQVVLKVDTTTTLAADGSGGGRESVRIESIKPVNKGLVIGNFEHMPGSVCGSWPAFWMYGPNYPAGGEIDIIEGANNVKTNLFTAHTSPGCMLPQQNVGYAGTQGARKDCGPDPYNLGCSYGSASNVALYGDTFNSNPMGATYAMEWTDQAIKVWSWPASMVPADVAGGQPIPNPGWGQPQALFGGSACDVNTFFKDMKIVLNMDLCGDYAGAVWGVADNCPAVTGKSTCNEWVAQNPGNLTDVFWTINSIKVYELKPLPNNIPENYTSSFPSLATPVRTPSSTPLGPTRSILGTGTNTSPTGTSTATGTPNPNPSTLPASSGGTWNLIGCLDAGSTFNQTSSSPAMTPALCTPLCGGKAYAAVFNTTCYCADTLGGSSSPNTTSTGPSTLDSSRCDLLCPGNPSQRCGGLLDPSSNRTALTPRSPRFRRAAPPGVLLTVYAFTAAVVDPVNPGIPPQAPAMAAGAGTTAATTGVFSTLTLTRVVTYTDVCLTPVPTLTCKTATICQTAVVPPGCTTTPAVLMTPVPKACSGCPGAVDGIVTVELPVGKIIAGGNGTGPIISGADGVRLGGVFLGMVGGLVLALLL